MKTILFSKFNVAVVKPNSQLTSTNININETDLTKCTQSQTSRVPKTQYRGTLRALWKKLGLLCQEFFEFAEEAIVVLTTRCGGCRVLLVGMGLASAPASPTYSSSSGGTKLAPLVLVCTTGRA